MPEPISKQSIPFFPLPRKMRSSSARTKFECPPVEEGAEAITPVKTGFPPLGSDPLRISKPSRRKSPSVSMLDTSVPTIRSPRSERKSKSESPSSSGQREIGATSRFPPLEGETKSKPPICKLPGSSIQAS